VRAAWGSWPSSGRTIARISAAASNLNFPGVVFVTRDDPARTTPTGLYTRHRMRVCYAAPVRRASTPMRRGASASLAALSCSPRGLPRSAQVHWIRFLS